MTEHTAASVSASAPPARCACSHGTITSTNATAAQPQAPKVLYTFVSAVRMAKWLRQMSAWATMA